MQLIIKLRIQIFAYLHFQYVLFVLGRTLFVLPAVLVVVIYHFSVFLVVCPFGPRRRRVGHRRMRPMVRVRLYAQIQVQTQSSRTAGFGGHFHLFRGRRGAFLELWRRFTIQLKNRYRKMYFSIDYDSCYYYWDEWCLLFYTSGGRQVDRDC